MATPTVRSRRPFQYPTEDDSSDDDAPSIMDEQEQESYIRTLTALNTTRNTHYTHLLLLLPLLSAIPPLLALLRTNSSPLLPLLALTSLAATTFLLVMLPPTKTGIAFLDSRSGGGEEGGPLVRYLPYLVPVLATVVGVVGWLRGGGAAPWWVLPGVVHAAGLGAKVVMGGVDPGELEGLRYGYKGA